MKQRAFETGKIPPSALQKLVLPYLRRRGGRLLIGPGIGRDAAVVRYQKSFLVLHADPITGTTRRIGEHSVYVNANDIATTGARPVWYMCTILLPPGTEPSYLQGLMTEIKAAASGLGVSVIGGHTEITPGLSRPIIAGFMVGESSKEKVLSSDRGRNGDVILLTKTAGLEGTAILASNYAHRLNGLRPQLLARARKFSKQIGVVKEALAVARIDGVHALHDPTEGGVLNGLWELAEASRLGIEVYGEEIPVAIETMTICRVLRLDPLKLMSSGSLIISVKPSKAKAAKKVLSRMHVTVSEVGRLTSMTRGRSILRGTKRLDLKAVPRDELYRIA